MPWGPWWWECSYRFFFYLLDIKFEIFIIASPYWFANPQHHFFGGGGEQPKISKNYFILGVNLFFALTSKNSVKNHFPRFSKGGGGFPLELLACNYRLRIKKVFIKWIVLSVIKTHLNHWMSMLNGINFLNFISFIYIFQVLTVIQNTKVNVAMLIFLKFKIYFHFKSNS